MKKTHHKPNAILMAKVQLLKKKKPPIASKADMLLVIPGSGGSLTHIAHCLKLQRSQVEKLLDRNDFEDVRNAFINEVERVADAAEDTVYFSIKQRKDLAVALKAAAWFLSRRRSNKFGDYKRVIHEGGDQPIQTRNVNVNIDISDLDLPVEMKRKILEAIDKKRDQQLLIDKTQQ